MKNWRLMQSDGEGYFDTHTDGLSEESAREMLARHQKCFPNTDWYIEEYTEEPREERTHNESAVDGHEDLYPSYENFAACFVESIFH